MDSFLPYMTNDYSIGLYDKDVGDIYHSAYGALTESFEKFINPIKHFILKKNEIKVLDICYGIGYNTKALLEEQINKKNRIHIDCVDTNKNLMELSPFISNSVGYIKRKLYTNDLYKNINDVDNIKKILLSNNYKSKYKISTYVNFIILKNISEQFKEGYLNDDSLKFLNSDKKFLFFDENLVKIYEILSKKQVILPQKRKINAFVHNIYYRYISKRYEYKYSKFDHDKFCLNFIHKDIRDFIRESDTLYDIIFLDGFTPNKCPCIWSLDLFKQLYNHLSTDGIITTYNTSAPVRNGLVNTGFFIGNILNDNSKVIGTIASKNKKYILYPLTKIESELLNTKAGIPYRDNNLNLDNDTILNNRKLEVQESNLLNTSKYLKKIKMGTNK